MLAEFELDDLAHVSNTIIARSRRVVEMAIAELPKGTWRHAIMLDGYDKPIRLAAALTIAGREISVDFDGSSQASPFGINVVTNYCLAYTAFALKCIIAPEIPNNAGSLAPFRITTPAGSILNAQRPWPVSARHVVGLMLPDLIFGCLDQAMPGRVPAEGASCNWTVQLRRDPDQADAQAPIFDTVFFNTGGCGARPIRDGLSATAFPSGVKAMPVEVVEYVAPVVVWIKELAAELRRRRSIPRRPGRARSRSAPVILHRFLFSPCSNGSSTPRRGAPAATPVHADASTCVAGRNCRARVSSASLQTSS